MRFGTVAQFALAGYLRVPIRVSSLKPAWTHIARAAGVKRVHAHARAAGWSPRDSLRASEVRLLKPGWALHTWAMDVDTPGRAHMHMLTCELGAATSHNVMMRCHSNGMRCGSY